MTEGQAIVTQHFLRQHQLWSQLYQTDMMDSLNNGNEKVQENTAPPQFQPMPLEQTREQELSANYFGRKKAPYDPGFNGKVNNAVEALKWVNFNDKEALKEGPKDRDYTYRSFYVNHFGQNTQSAAQN